MITLVQVLFAAGSGAQAVAGLGQEALPQARPDQMEQLGPPATRLSHETIVWPTQSWAS